MHEHGGDSGFCSIGAIAAGTGIEPNDVTDEVERLCDAGYLRGPLHKALSGGDTRGWFLENSHLGERGLRQVGAWPSDDPYEALVAIIERQIAATSDQGRRSKLQALLGSVGDVGKATVAGLLVELAKGGVHF
ncbi:MAG: hypothetical protein ACLQPH_02585 [Acidimicrobiales bacterium]